MQAGWINSARRIGYCDSGAYESQPTSVAVVAGSAQSTPVNTAFSAALQARVRDVFNNLLGGVFVTFTGPVSGAGMVSAGADVSDLFGNAFYGATANGTKGTYGVTAATNGATSSNFTLTNRNPYSVTYSGNGNTSGIAPTDSNDYLAAATVTVLGNTGGLTRIGSTFAGWNTVANGSGTAYVGGNTFAIGSNVTLYAQWTPISTLSVTYNGNGNTGGSPPGDVNAYVAGATVTALGNNGNLVKTGSTFSGWNTAANASGTSYAVGTTFTNNANVTLFAQWTLTPTFTVTYNGNGSTGGTPPIDGNAYAAGATGTVAGNTGVLTRVGYTFAGWNTAANGSGTGYVGGNTFAISANMTLYAQWTAIPTYSVSYNGNTGGTPPIDGNAYVAGATVTVAGNTGVLTRVGYTFAGWSTAANGSGTNYAAGTTFAINANVALYAKWAALPTFSVTYNGNGNIGGTPPTDANAYVAGATVTALGNNGNLVKTGLTFLGWNTAANGGGASYAVGTTFAIGSGNTTLFAIWGNAVTCTLDVDGNGSIDALTDGLIVVRAMLGFTGIAVTNGAVGGGTPTRATWNLIQPYLNTYCGTNFLP